MNISAILLAMVVVGGTGLLIAILLGIASEKFKVPVDEKEVAIRAELPGNNCGGCGYAGCDGLAKAIANGEAPVNGCPVGGAAAAEKISAIMGVEAGEFVKKVAFVKCAGTCEKASDKYQYSGVQSCIEAMNVPGAGPKGCEFGCMGFGSCAAVCPENAISIVNGIAHIDEEACVGCGKCAETCPKALIDLVQEYSAALKNSVKTLCLYVKQDVSDVKHAKKYVNLEQSKLKTTSHRSITINV